MYGMVAWGSAYNNNIDLINSVLQKIQKIIYKKYKHLPEFEEEYKKLLSVKNLYYITVIKSKIQYLIEKYKLKQNRTRKITPISKKKENGTKK